MAGAGYRVSFEAFVNSEAKDERITRSQAALHLRERLNQSLIAHGGMLRPFRVAGTGRFGFEPRNKIRPHWLGTGTLFCHGLYPVAEHGARVGVYGAFDDLLVVIDQKTRGNE